MFERFTEKARRVVFYARYEASQYGSPMIDTEHLLLGFLREDKELTARFLGGIGVAEAIRSEIERRITVREHISTAIEVPLTEDGKKVLTFAIEEAERLSHKYVGTEHLFAGMLRTEGSLAAQILAKKGVKLETVREELKKRPPASPIAERPESSAMARQVVETFLAALKEHDVSVIFSFFAEGTQIVDCKGKLWRNPQEAELEVLFAPYAKKNVRPLVDTTSWGPADSLAATVLWENVSMPGESTRSTHRMTVVFAQQPPSGLLIFFLQVTPVIID